MLERGVAQLKPARWRRAKPMVEVFMVGDRVFNQERRVMKRGAEIVCDGSRKIEFTLELLFKKSPK